MIIHAKQKPNLKDEKRKKSIDAIIRSARAVFVERGFAGTSMSQIAKGASVPQALIYHYFASKEELWKAVKKSGLEASQQPADFGGSQAKDFPDFLKIVLKNRADFYRKNPELYKIIQWEALEGSSKEKLLGVSKTFEGIWTKELKRLQDLKKIPTTLDPKLLSALIRNALMGVFDDVPSLYKAKEVAKKQEEYITMVYDVLVSLAS